MGTLFAIGSSCFAIGAMPGYASAVGVTADGVTFFIGSIFFTTAAFLQLLEAIANGTRVDRWSSAIQFIGTLFFNVSTFHALDTSLSALEADRQVWRPDAFGSICFLVSSAMAYRVFAADGFWSWRRSDRQWTMAALNFAGSIAFGISAIASFVVPATGDLVSVQLTNLGTFAGAVCFFAAAILVVIDEVRL
jgi:hypothetical protein